MIRKLTFISLLGLLTITACAITPDIERADLARKYLEKPDDLIEVSATTLHVRDSGPQNAEAVILIHGFGSSLHTWDAWAQILERNYRVLRLDLPGAGLSPPDATNDYSDSRIISLLLALMDKNGLDKAAIIGNSIGGRIAWTMAVQHPQRVDRLVLMAPDGFASPGFEYGVKPETPAILHASKYFLPRWALRPNLSAAYADETKLSEKTIERYHDLLLASGNRAALIQRLEQTILMDPVPKLQKITAPVLLLWGEEDALIPVANAQNYLDALPDARLVTLPRTGHLPMEEAPEASLAPVLDFLNGK